MNKHSKHLVLYIIPRTCLALTSLLGYGSFISILFLLAAIGMPSSLLLWLVNLYLKVGGNCP
uniref:Uncharacterized protein n=1 Tax=Rhizophora mucronata TaxID=61149 RepID=A0A2P2QP86_RHIMU